ncbi:GNAT family N-acetyltransferase [Streptomyces sp. NPDC004134]|uniref:GNAT family N-acetyltransferase n=1 Tax=Streptomyces sp. NPDC004134 TaxID=3364691 RepID=UPI0036B14DB4
MERDAGRLLALQVTGVHGLARGSAGGLPTVSAPAGVRAVWAWSPGARLVAVAEDLAGTGHERALSSDPPPYEAERAPRPMEALARTLDGTLEGGPSYVFPPALPPLRPPPLPLLVSDASGLRRARSLRRPANWEPGEWAELTTGTLGPWAMAIDDDTPVSICHTPASTPASAEAGAWTHPAHRGRGLAPHTVAAWAHLQRARVEALFYSTTTGNHASRAVARTLNLTPLGWLWTVTQP